MICILDGLYEIIHLVPAFTFLEFSRNKSQSGRESMVQRSCDPYLPCAITDAAKLIVNVYGATLTIIRNCI